MLKLKKDGLRKLIVSIAICEIVGSLPSLVTLPSITTWYASLNKPAFNPPNWLFGPVWTILFFLMGVSLYLVWDKGLKKHDVRIAVKLFSIQFGLNVMWSLLFFGLHNIFLGLADISLLWLAIFVTMLKFHKISRKAAYLLVPYLAWVSFALMLNYFVLILN